MQEAVKVVVCDLYEEPCFTVHFEKGYPQKPELRVDTATAASPEKLERLLQRAEKEWEEIKKAQRGGEKAGGRISRAAGRFNPQAF